MGAWRGVAGCRGGGKGGVLGMYVCGGICSRGIRVGHMHARARCSAKGLGEGAWPPPANVSHTIPRRVRVGWMWCQGFRGGGRHAPGVSGCKGPVSADAL